MPRKPGPTLAEGCCPRQNGGLSVLNICGVSLEQGSGNLFSGGPKVKWMERRRGGSFGFLGFHWFYQGCPDHGHGLPGAWKLRWSWFGKSLSRSFLNKELRLIHLLLGLCCEVNINPNGNLEQNFRNWAHLGLASPRPNWKASGASWSGLSSFFKDASPAASLGGPLGPHPHSLPLLCLVLGLFGCGCHGLATPPTLRGGQWPLGVHIKHRRLVQPQCQSASLEGNKHVLIKTKHFQTGVSCWNFLAAPKAVVIMETLTAFLLFKGCAKHIRW